jgi:hypothetical protein
MKRCKDSGKTKKEWSKMWDEVVNKMPIHADVPFLNLLADEMQYVLKAPKRKWFEPFGNK